MDIQKQVTCRELSEKLKDAGYPQDDGLWYWWLRQFKNAIEEEKIYLIANNADHNQRQWDYSDDHPTYTFTKIAVAPTVAELGEKLPDNTRIHRENGEWWCYTDTSPSIAYEKESDARAGMWLYLKYKDSK